MQAQTTVIFVMSSAAETSLTIFCKKRIARDSSAPVGMTKGTNLFRRIVAVFFFDIGLSVGAGQLPEFGFLGIGRPLKRSICRRRLGVWARSSINWRER